MGRLLRSPVRFPALAAALAASILAQDAWAQNPQALAKARERFKEAAALQAQGDFARALEAYKEVALVKSSAQVRFNIATCEEKTGDYVRAAGSYQLALTEATNTSSKEIEASVQKALSRLEPRIPMLLVNRGEGATVAEITLDGRPLTNPSIGVEFKVNPGPHAIRATASDKKPFSVDVTLADGEHKKVDIVLKPVPAPAPPRPVLLPSSNEEPPLPPPPPNTRPMKIAGFVVGGAGIVGLGVSAGFFAMRQKAISTLNGECGADHGECPPSALSTKNSGVTDSTVSTAAFVTGLAFVGIGGILIGVASKKSAPPPTAGLVVMPGGGALRLSF